MYRNKKHFLDFLHGNMTKNVIFEPFIVRELTEALIWRRGNYLWDTPADSIATLASCTERTKSDFFFIDLSDFPKEQWNELITEIDSFKNGDSELGVGIICRNREEVNMFEDSADCLCIFGDAISKKVPTVRMDGTPEDAITRGDLGWFAPNNAVKYLTEYGDKIKILGGLDTDFIKTSTPIKIYDCIEKIAEDFHGKWACGSGGAIPGDKYLEFISLLGGFGRIRKI